MPRALFSERIPDVHVGAFCVELVYLRRELVQAAAIFLDIAVYALPLRYWVPLIEEARLDYLVPVRFFRKPRLVCHRGSAIQSDRPGEFSRPLFFVPPVHKRLQCHSPRHDLLGIDAFERVRVFFCKQEDRVVHLFDEALQIFLGKEVNLMGLRVLIEISTDTNVAPLVAMLLIGPVV